MSFITAERIHDGHKWLPVGTVLEVANDGTIIDFHSDVKDGVVCYEGVLTPGFVNAHCHLELSHMKGVVPEQTGLIPFLQSIPKYRNDFSDKQKLEARHKAYEELLENGVVAVGDIANVTDTTDVRGLDKLHVHSFVEAIGFAENPEKQFARSADVYDAFAAQVAGSKELRQSIVPHAPYSVSFRLFRMIDDHDKQALISIHNQESRAEDEYYLLKQGPVQSLLHGMNIDDDFFQPSGKTSLQTYLEWLSPTHPFIFIHNTYTSLTDLQVAKAYLPEVYWCFCPNANLYIENALPDVDMFVQAHAKICIGTDSLASNHQLSVLAELYTIKQHHLHISWENLITWGTYNGACALQMDDAVGSLQTGMQPGVLQIQGLDSNAQPVVKRIV